MFSQKLRDTLGVIVGLLSFVLISDGCDARHGRAEFDAEGDVEQVVEEIPDAEVSRDVDIDSDRDIDEDDADLNQNCPDREVCGEGLDNRCHGSQGEESWEVFLPGATFGSSTNIVRHLSDGGMIIAANTGDWSAWEEDILLVRTDSQGFELWRQVFGDPRRDWVHDVRETADGGFVITGLTVDDSEIGFWDFILIKTDASGNEQWTRTFSEGQDSQAFAVNQTPDGGYMVAGRTMYRSVNWDALIIRTDSLGNEEWRRTYGGDDYEAAYDLRPGIDGGYVFSGASGPGDYRDAWLVGIDENGDVQWDRTFGEPYAFEGALRFSETTDGGFILAGLSDRAALVLKVDSQGQQEWLRKYEAPRVRGQRIAHDVFETDGCGYVIAGMTYSGPDGEGSYNGWIARLGHNGEECWSRTFGGQWMDEFSSISRSPEGNFVVAGYYSRTERTIFDLWLMEFCID